MEENLECKLCNKTFIKKHQYQVHMKGTQHQNKVEQQEQIKSERAKRAELRPIVLPLYLNYQKIMFDLIVTNDKKKIEKKDNLEESIILLYKGTRPRNNIQKKRKCLFDFMKVVVGQLWPTSSLQIYGSVLMKLDSEESDIDVCMTNDGEENVKLENLVTALEVCNSPHLRITSVMTAKIPVVTIEDSLAQVKMDFSSWKLDMAEMKMIVKYLDYDDRVRPLVYAIRHWAKSRKISDAFSGLIKIFAWTVMVLAFMQMEGILPTPEKLDERKQQENENRTNVGDLCVKFFQFLNEFDSKEKRISLRYGGIFDKECPKFDDETLFCVECPRNNYTNMTCHVTIQTHRTLVHEWKRALAVLLSGASFDDLCRS